jgi:hypothetical protein
MIGSGSFSKDGGAGAGGEYARTGESTRISEKGGEGEDVPRIVGRDTCGEILVRWCLWALYRGQSWMMVSRGSL